MRSRARHIAAPRPRTLVLLAACAALATTAACRAPHSVRSPHSHPVERPTLTEAVENALEVADRALDNIDAWVEDNLN